MGCSVMTIFSHLLTSGFLLIVLLNCTRSQSILGNKRNVASISFGETLTVTSQNYPNDYNAGNSVIHWFVSGPEDYQVVAKFHEFKLETGYDFLRIGSGLNASDKTSQLVQLSGYSLPDDVVSANNEMWLLFTSDEFVATKGFRIDIQASTPGNLSDDSETPDDYHMDVCFTESCFGNDKTLVCKCDDLCHSFGDCCPGFPLPVSNSSPAKDTASESIDLAMWDCVTNSFLPQVYPKLQHGYRMIVRCPFEWVYDESLRRSCEDVPLNATVDVLYVYGDLYFRNLACATCHGYERSSLIEVDGSADTCSWSESRTLKCKRQILLPHFHTSRYYTNISDVYLTRVKSVPLPRLCLVGRIMNDSCPDGTSTEIAHECQYFYKPFVSQGVVNKNPSCNYCNGGPLVRCPYPVMDGQRGVLGPDGGPADYEPELPCTPGPQGPPGIREPPSPWGLSCETDLAFPGFQEVFWPINEPPTPLPVKTVQCLEGFKLDENGVCVPIPSDWPVCIFRRLEITQSIGAKDCLESILCSWQVPHCLLGPSRHATNETVTFTLLYGDGVNLSLDTILENVILRIQTSVPYECPMVGFSVGQSCYLDNRRENASSSCPEEEFVGHYFDFTPSPVNNESLIFLNGTYVRPRWWSNVTSIEFSASTQGYISSGYHFILCGTEVALQTCSSFKVTNDSVEWVHLDNQSYILHQGQMYDARNILINPNGSLSICNLDQNTSIAKRVQLILGHILFGASSVCLFVTLIPYFVFPTLRNRQGITIMNLIVALFLGQVMLQYIPLSVSNWYVPCIAFAALSHLFFLASFVWTTILAWDLSRSFAASKMKIISHSSFGCRMVAFVLVGWGVPLLFVGITLVLQFGGFKNGPILEYDSETCWLSKLSSIAMFFAPVSVCFLSNVVLFVITVHGVHSTKKATSVLKTGQESHLKKIVLELTIYIKISLLLGFAWLFGFLTMVINVPFMKYLFIIVISLQGVFIFVSFGANSRVKKLWRTRLESSTLWTTLSSRFRIRGNKAV